MILQSTAIYQAKQKLTAINQANNRKISSEELIKFAHRISASNAVASPPTWMPGILSCILSLIQHPRKFSSLIWLQGQNSEGKLICICQYRAVDIDQKASATSSERKSLVTLSVFFLLCLIIPYLVYVHLLSVILV